MDGNKKGMTPTIFETLVRAEDMQSETMKHLYELMRERVKERQAMTKRLKEMIVERLQLPVDAEWITDDQPLIGRGLELDSVDALELVVGVESEYGVSITDDRLDVFGSINRLADFIERSIEEAAADDTVLFEIAATETVSSSVVEGEGSKTGTVTNGTPLTDDNDTGIV